MTYARRDLPGMFKGEPETMRKEKFSVSSKTVHEVCSQSLGRGRDSWQIGKKGGS